MNHQSGEDIGLEPDHQDSIEQKFENLYPNYDYSLESSSNEKDARKRKRMKTMY